MSSKSKHRFKVYILPNAHTETIKIKEDGILHIHVKAPPEKGKANERLIRLIADWMEINKNEICIVQGKTSKVKLLEIPDEFKLKFSHKLTELKKIK